MFKKGDTIKFRDESIGLVLNDGLKGKAFVRKYNKSMLDIIYQNGNVGRMYVNSSLAFYDHRCRQEAIFYSILLGDRKGWISDLWMQELQNYNDRLSMIESAIDIFEDEQVWLERLK